MGGTIKYCRCSVYNGMYIEYPALLQEKMDGTYRMMIVRTDNVYFVSRSGKQYTNPVLASQVMESNLPNGVYMGEFTIPNMDRFESNGICNSKKPDYNSIIYTVWDYMPEVEYLNICLRPYYLRFIKLSLMKLPPNMRLVRTWFVENRNQVMAITHKLMSEGSEGTVLKDTRFYFVDHSSGHKLMQKIKLKIDADVRVISFTEGQGKYKDLIGALVYGTDDGKITGQVSGMTDALRKDISSNKDKYMNQIFTLEFNDLTNLGSLSHPRFKKFRDDKTETDTEERIKEMINMRKSQWN